MTTLAHIMKGLLCLQVIKSACLMKRVLKQTYSARRRMNISRRTEAPEVKGVSNTSNCNGIKEVTESSDDLDSREAHETQKEGNYLTGTFNGSTNNKFDSTQRPEIGLVNTEDGMKKILW